MKYLAIYIICVVFTIAGWCTFFDDPNLTSFFLTMIVTIITISPIIYFIHTQVKKKKQEKQRIREEEKQLKEKRLKEVDKLERQLNEEKTLLNLRENEFKKATQGHIYSTDINIDETKYQISDNDTPYQKLKKLRALYENNVITREEYERQRRALL